MNQPQSVTIRDTKSESEAEILVGFGFNCFRFQTTVKGQRADVIWADNDFHTGQQRPSGGGIPILFPFPGRIQGTSFPWEGRTYALEDGDGLGNAIHGFLHCRPWRVVESNDESVVGQNSRHRSMIQRCSTSGRRIIESKPNTVSKLIVWTFSVRSRIAETPLCPADSARILTSEFLLLAKVRPTNVESRFRSVRVGNL